MGSSLVKFRGKAFWVSDSLLEGWLYILSREIDTIPNKPEWFVELKEKWHYEATKGGSGWIFPNLDGWLTDERRILDLLSLCQAGLRRLEEYGDVIPKTEADKMGPEGSFYLSDPSTRDFKKLGLHFMKLLRGEVDTVGSTSRTKRFFTRLADKSSTIHSVSRTSQLCYTLFNNLLFSRTSFSLKGECPSCDTSSIYTSGLPKTSGILFN